MRPSVAPKADRAAQPSAASPKAESRATGQARDAADVLAEAAETFRERRKVYGDNYLKYGKLCEALYPGGLTLRTADDFSRFELFTFVLVKLSRFSNSGLSHKDSVHDAAVYCAMLEVLTTSRPVGSPSFAPCVPCTSPDKCETDRACEKGIRESLEGAS